MGISTKTQKKSDLGKTMGNLVLYALVIIVSIMTIFPIYWMLVSTFQPAKYTLHYPPPLFPQEITLTQFADLFANHPIARWLRNSFLIALMTMLISTSLTVMGAYALSSLRWKGRSSFGLFLLVTQMLPEILIIIPLYRIYQQLDLLDSLPALSLIDAAFALPICIWILKGVFDTVPSEVLDAAVVDGCTEWSVLWRSELRSVLTGYRRDGSLDESQVREIMAAAEAAFAGREHYLPSDRVFAVTETSRLSAYDAEFVALAEILGAPLVTADRAVLTAFSGALTVADALESLG